MREGSDITLISTGTETPRVVDAADILAADGIDAHVVHVPTIKPFDVAGIVAAAEKTGRVVTVEEHTVIGGLGGAVAETLSEYRPTRVDRIGIQDHYTESATDEELLDMYCLSAERVAQRVQKLLASDGTGDQLRMRSRVSGDDRATTGSRRDRARPRSAGG